MNNEENRLQTFSVWPSDSVIDPSRIAKAGFFSTGNELEVECFACGGKISDWNYGDQVMALHRQLNPQCPFVINPSSSGNIPKITSQDSTYRSERARLESFSNWPSNDIVAPLSLAKAGFYFLKSDDKVKCAFCSGICGFWERGDDPKVEHKRHFPNCIFVRANFDLESKNGSTNSLPEALQMQELGIQSHRGPKQPRFATLESRLRSFLNWDTDLIQTPEMLADAGFYYVGTGDQVRCFYCDGGLRHWDPQDVPWSEHARWFPTCGFVILVKGHDFIESCTPRDSALNFMDVDTNMRSSDPTEAYLTTPQAQGALEIGISRKRVKAAIKYQLQKHGRMFGTIDELIDAAFKLQVRDSVRDERDGHPSNPERSRSSDDRPRHEIRFLEPERRHNSNEPPRNSSGNGRSSNCGSSSNGTSSSSSNVKPSNSLTAPKRDEGASSKERSSSRSPSPKVSLEEENRQLKEARLCKICLDKEMGVVFLPCGHLSTCITCAPSLKTCPVCRAIIKGTVRTFIS